MDRVSKSHILKSFFIRTLFLLGLICTITVISTNNVFAEAGPGNGGTRKRTEDVGYGRGYGATWVYYASNSDSVTFPAETAGKGATATGCGQYGGFYALVNLGYNHATDSFTSYPVGSNQLHNLQPMGGGYVYRTGANLSDNIGGGVATTVSSGEPLDAIQAKFLSMPDEAKQGQTWSSASNLGWFCYGDGEISSGGKVWSTSAVAASTGGEMVSGLDGEVLMTVAKRLVNTEDVTATFTHRIVSASEPSAGMNVNINWSVSGASSSSNNPPNGTQNLSTGAWSLRPDGKWETVVSTSVSVKVPSGGGKICQRIDYNPKNITIVSGGSGGGSGSGHSRACISAEGAESVPSCAVLGGTSNASINSGNTNGVSKVQNLNAGNGWKSEVWARPGDTIQFAHCFSWGVQAVRKSDSYGAARVEPRTATALSDRVEPSWYQITSQRGDNYLFGLRHDQGSIGQQVTIKRFNPVAYWQGGDKIAAESNGGYELILMSPSTKTVDATRYNCLIFDFAQFRQNGFQIPGLHPGFGSCEAINTTGQPNEVGRDKAISQTITYAYQEAWVHERHWKTGSCTCMPVSSPARDDETYYNAQNLGYAGGNGSISYDQTYRDSWNNCIVTSCGTSGTSGNNDGYCPSYDGSRCSCSTTPHVDYQPAEYDDKGNKTKDSVPYQPARYSIGCSGYASRGLSTRHPVHFADYGPRSSTAVVKTPYNFNTADTSSINAGSVIYAGEKVSSAFTASVLPRRNTSITSTNSPYATLYPGDIKIEQFIIPANASIPANSENGVYTIKSSMCDFFGGKECGEIPINNRGDNWRNGQGRYNGWTWSASYEYNVPNNVNIGAKYCVAIGMTIADSHSQPNAASVSGWENLNSKWRVSLSCRTIAKKPNFQAWNANLYTEGRIETSQSNKYEQARIGTNNDANRVFGSWEEYIAIAKKTISGFGSGASLGYNASNLSLVGGHSPTSNLCDLSNLTISNTDCSKIGRARISLSEAVLNRIFARYFPYNLETNNPSSVINVNRASKLSVTADSNVTTAEYIATSGNASIDNTIVRPKNSPVLVIRVPGTLTINANICYGGGACANNTNNSLILANRNSETFSSLSELPQIIILANNINISANVTQIDAWLVTVGTVANEGIVDTCAGFIIGSSSSNDCNKTLLINGPTIANTILLNRTAGAWTRTNFNQNDGPGASNDLSDDGSVTPAEIFNYRPDTLLWSYGQSQDFSQATVTYERELPPRY